MTGPSKNHGRMVGPAEVRFERMLPRPIETIWEFLTDSDKRGEWLASGPMDQRVGGKANLTFRHAELSPHKVPAPEKYKNLDSELHRSEHTITRIDAPHLLAFTWPPNSEVTFELKPQGDQVLLTVTHRQFGSREKMVMTSGGWHTHLDILVERANGRTPPAFWAVFGNVEAEYDQLYPKG